MTEETPKTLRERLLAVQIGLKAPKGQTNDFGKYNYRSCEDIMEAVKPLLAEQGLVLTISDELVCVGDRYYIKTEARLRMNGDAKISSYGYAREDKEKKGMSEAQITGSTSSYARKYALNGLFLIDDTKDADTNEHKEAADNKHEEGKPEFTGWKSGVWVVKTKQSLLDMKNVDGKTPEEIVKAVQAKYKISKVAREAIETLVK